MAGDPKPAGGGSGAAPPEEKGGGDEADVVRAAIYFLIVLLVGLVVVLLFLRGKRDDFREAVQYGEKNMKKMAATYDGVRGLLKEYETSHADEAQTSTSTWLKQRYSAALIQDAQVTVEPWKNRPSKDFVENYVDVVVKATARQNAVQFLWNVERSSTKMKTIEMSLKRAAPNNQPDADIWDLHATFGYRVPRGLKE